MEHKIRIDGLTPLLQSNGAQVLLPKPTGTRTVKQQFDAPTAAALGVYKTPSGDFGHPTAAFRRAFIEAAKQHKVGKQSASKLLSGALDIEPADLATITDIDGTPLKDYAVDVRVVVNHNAGGARIPAAKPRFDDWHTFLTLSVDERIWPANEDLTALLFTIMDEAGRVVGVGSGRPELRKLSFGKFAVTNIA